MAHLTINIDDRLLRASKVFAAEHGTSISKLVRTHLSELTGMAPNSTTADPLELFSRGAIGRKDAMSALGVDYGALIDLLVERGLSLPSLPDDELERMADDMNRVLDEAGR
jgi:plasmid stability protein